MFGDNSLELGEKFFSRSYAPGTNIQVARVNLRFDLFVARFQAIFQFMRPRERS
jgi:hypothetical protein